MIYLIVVLVILGFGFAFKCIIDDWREDRATRLKSEGEKDRAEHQASGRRVRRYRPGPPERKASDATPPAGPSE